MSDLNSQLRQVADAAASQARPIAAAEVIRRGNRRRQRVITQRSLGGLSAVGIGAAVVLTGAASNPSAPAASSASAAHGITVTEKTTSALGKLSITLKYADERHAKVNITSLAYSAHSKAAIRHPALLLTLRPTATSKRGTLTAFAFIMLTPGDRHNFAGTVSSNIFASVHNSKGTAAGVQITVSLVNHPSKKHISINVRSVLQDGLIIN